ncbi:MAG: hypothetical protein H0X24_19750, partial [Ktedonobacterales bacterium]|nr:hypothetical protein [Ktedonobacterales bacterium]
MSEITILLFESTARVTAAQGRALVSPPCVVTRVATLHEAQAMLLALAPQVLLLVTRDVA